LGVGQARSACLAAAAPQIDQQCRVIGQAALALGVGMADGTGTPGEAGGKEGVIARTTSSYPAAIATGWRAIRRTRSDASRHAAPLARNARK
jgi:hypothetical protein